MRVRACGVDIASTVPSRVSLLQARLPHSVSKEVLEQHVPRAYLYETPDSIALCDFVSAARGAFGAILSSAIEALHLAISSSPDAKAVQRQRVPLKGYLHKQSHASAKWLRRWFVLENGALRYAKKQGGKVKGMMTFTDLSTVRIVPESPLPYVFLVDNGVPNQYMYLQAESPLKLQAWVSTVRKHMGIIQHEPDDFNAWGMWPGSSTHPGTDPAQEAEAQAKAEAKSPKKSKKKGKKSKKKKGWFKKGKKGKKAAAAAAAENEENSDHEYELVARAPGFLPPRLSGSISRRSKFMKKWSKQYGVLDDGELVIYAKRHGSVKAAIELDAQTRVKRAEDVRVNCIHVFKSKKEQMYLQASDEESFNKWYTALRQHVAHIKTKKPQQSQSSDDDD